MNKITFAHVGIILALFLVACLLMPEAKKKEEKAITFIIGGPIMWVWFFILFGRTLVKEIIKRRKAKNKT